MKSLWKETRDVTLKCGLTITVRHAGSEEDPFIWDTVRAAWVTSLEKARADARRAIRAEYGSLGKAVEDAQADAREMGADAEAVDAITPHVLVEKRVDSDALFSKYVKDVVMAGTSVGQARGVDAYRAIFAEGGPAALIEAFNAVHEFNAVKASTGEA